MAFAGKSMLWALLLYSGIMLALNRDEVASSFHKYSASLRGSAASLPMVKLPSVFPIDSNGATLAPKKSGIFTLAGILVEALVTPSAVYR